MTPMFSLQQKEFCYYLGKRRTKPKKCIFPGLFVTSHFYWTLNPVFQALVSAWPQFLFSHFFYWKLYCFLLQQNTARKVKNKRKMLRNCCYLLFVISKTIIDEKMKKKTFFYLFSFLAKRSINCFWSSQRV